jgi:hypothetical protein
MKRSSPYHVLVYDSTQYEDSVRAPPALTNTITNFTWPLTAHLQSLAVRIQEKTFCPHTLHADACIVLHICFFSSFLIGAKISSLHQSGMFPVSQGIDELMQSQPSFFRFPPLTPHILAVMQFRTACRPKHIML